MGEKLSILKTLVIPAIVSLLIFLLLTYIVIPLYRRYNQYIPLGSVSPVSLRDRLLTRIAAIANRREDSYLTPDAQTIDHNDEQIDEGEELGDVDDHMRLVIASHARATRQDTTRRLSRDLEEGFRDDSDDEAPPRR
ncbi:unnamed protein product [Clonostachys byssicola]|uniref:Uncharacterized protein n=1 Tax=Clonostachys byssicola TaxID=160290 RepID=A0A9N9YAQ0_9HYPO|nr:unnamed protein product [Clonostachys byssicola]